MLCVHIVGSRMKKIIALLCICFLQGTFCHPQETELRGDLSQQGKKVTPNQFGIFIEEINHAGDGGLYAELIRNGSFTEAPTLDAWSAVRTGQAKVNLFFESVMPLNPVKARSLRIEVNSPNGERAGVANEGYWGIAVKNGDSYEFSMYARSRARTARYTGRPRSPALRRTGAASPDRFKPVRRIPPRAFPSRRA